MSLYSTLEKMRAWPEPKKKQAAFVGAFAITAVIFIVWAISFAGGVNKQVADGTLFQKDAAAQALSPLQSFTNQFKQILNLQP